MQDYVNLTPGDPAPWFAQRSFANPRYVFDTAAGRYIVLCFLGSAGDPHASAALDMVRAATRIFDDTTASFFAVSHDEADEREKRLADRYPGFRVFWDFDGNIGRLFGALPKDGTGSAGPLRRFWIVLDPALRVIRKIPFAPDRSDIASLIGLMNALPPPACHAGTEGHAPVLILPNVFEPAFCRALIEVYQRDGGTESGFMRDVTGQTTLVHDHRHKRRRDCTITDDALMQEIRARFHRRVSPMIERAFQFRTSRMERFIVACYDAADKAHFRPHRDNTTRGTAHRRFAATVNLNEDFDGGELSFPEYGPRSYKPPPGAAVVFSCSLLHTVSEVTRGQRFAFLPFLYDEEAAAIRQQNLQFLAKDTGPGEPG